MNSTATIPISHGFAGIVPNTCSDHKSHIAKQVCEIKIAIAVGASGLAESESNVDGRNFGRLRVVTGAEAYGR